MLGCRRGSQAGTHVIVAGDLNDYRGQPAIRRIRGLDDIWPDLIQTGQAQYFDEIDHILISDSVKSIAKIRARVLEHGNLLASDHRPFIVTLDLR